MASTTGQKAAAQAHAKPIVAPALVNGATAPAMHTFVPMIAFSIHWNGCTLTYNAGQRYVAEASLKSAIQATDRDVVWEN